MYKSNSAQQDSNPDIPPVVTSMRFDHYTIYVCTIEELSQKAIFSQQAFLLYIMRKLGQVQGFGQLNQGNIPAIDGKIKWGQFTAIAGNVTSYCKEYYQA